MSALPPAPPSADRNPYLDFQAGATAALRSWSALRTAVEQTWGGSESATKAEDLRHNIFTYFDGTSPKPKMKLEELEDNLLAYMEEEYGVVLEDGSEREVANLIWDMYELCAKGDARLARSVVEDAMRGEEVIKQSNVKMSVIQNGEDGDDDDDMDDSDAEGGGETTVMNDGTSADAGGMNTGQQQQQQPMVNSIAPVDPNAAYASYASGMLFGGPPKPKKELPPPRQLGDLEPEKPQPVVDDDGFAPVATKKKGKKR